MTIGVLWKSARAIYVVADSVVTSVGTPPERRTSFGQLASVRGRRIEELIGKVCPVAGGQAVVALSGSVSLATRFARVLEEGIQRQRPVREAATLALRSVTPVHSPDDAFCVLLGYFEEGRPIVQKVIGSPQHVQIMGDERCWLASTGSMDAFTETVIVQSIHSFMTAEPPRRPRSDSELLACVHAAFQSFAAHYDVIKHGIGGFLSGGCLTPGGFEWQAPLHFTLYSTNFLERAVSGTGDRVPDGVTREPPDILGTSHGVVGQEGTLFVQSNLSDSTAALLPPLATLSIAEITREYEYAKFMFDLALADHYIFLSRHGPDATIVSAPNLRNPNSLISIEELDDQFTVGLRQPLVDALSRAPVPANNPLGFRPTLATLDGELPLDRDEDES